MLQTDLGTRENLQVDQESRVVKLKGLPYNVSKHEIVEFFEDLEVVFVHFVFEQDGRPSGLAFVEFKSRTDAAHALKKRGHYLHKRYIKMLQVSYDEMKEQVLLGTSAIPTARYQPRTLGAPAGPSSLQAGARAWQPSDVVLLPAGGGGSGPGPSYARPLPPGGAPAPPGIPPPQPPQLSAPPSAPKPPPTGIPGGHQLIVDFEGDVVTTSTKSFRRLLACGSAVYVSGLRSHTSTIAQDVSHLFCAYRLDLPSMVYGVEPGGAPSGEVWLRFRAASELNGSLVKGSPIYVTAITSNNSRHWQT